MSCNVPGQSASDTQRCVCVYGRARICFFENFFFKTLRSNIYRLMTNVFKTRNRIKLNSLWAVVKHIKKNNTIKFTKKPSNFAQKIFCPTLSAHLINKSQNKDQSTKNHKHQINIFFFNYCIYFFFFTAIDRYVTYLFYIHFCKQSRKSQTVGYHLYNEMGQ